MSNLLNDTTYRKVNTDPITYFEKKTEKLLQESATPKEIKERLIFKKKPSNCPKRYGLTTIRKAECSVRPIVSIVGCSTQTLAKYITKELQPFAAELNYWLEIQNTLQNST